MFFVVCGGGSNAVVVRDGITGDVPFVHGGVGVAAAV